MLACKSSKANLEKCTRLFLLMGLVVALVAVEFAIEFKSKSQTSMEAVYNNSNRLDEEDFIPDTKVEQEILKQNIPVPPQPILEDIKIVSDKKNIVETVLSSTETDEKDAVVIQKIDYSNLKEQKVEEDVVEDIPFFVIEEVPKFPGCQGNNEQLKQCMQEKIQAFVSQNFNSEIAQDLGLEPGTKRIFVTFVIDKNGNIANIESRAPHKSLQLEAERVVKSLPKMEPGRQRGKPVRVKYSLPIVFQVME